MSRNLSVKKKEWKDGRMNQWPRVLGLGFPFNLYDIWYIEWTTCFSANYKKWWFERNPISTTHPDVTLRLPGQHRLRSKIVQFHHCSDAGHMTISANVVSPHGALKQLPAVTTQHIMAKGIPFTPNSFTMDPRNPGITLDLTSHFCSALMSPKTTWRNIETTVTVTIS